MTEQSFTDRYRLHNQLGAGGMGAVFRATDRLTGNTVALKRVRMEDVAPGATLMLSNDPSSSGDFRIVLAREFQTLASLHHPYIINVLDYGFALDESASVRLVPKLDNPNVLELDPSATYPYYTMPLLENAQTIIHAARGKNVETQVRYLVHLLQALIYLHRRHILHRDIKPANVLVDGKTDEIRVLDFGLAVPQNEAQGIAGTIAYIAPEVFMGSPYQISADLFSVGVIAFEMFAAHHPFENPDDMSSVITRILYHAPDYSRVDAPTPLVEWIANLLHKDPAARYPSAETALYALLQALNLNIPIETHATRESFLQAAQFIGREAEIQHLKESLDTIIHTAYAPATRPAPHQPVPPQAWLIGGESGVGKTRLLEELRIRALTQGALVIRSQSVQQSNALFDMWLPIVRRLILSVPITPREAQLLQTLIPDLARLLDSEPPPPHTLTPLEFNREWRALLLRLCQALAQPLVLLFEDLQWADDENLALLEEMAALAEETALLLIGTYRDDEKASLPATLPSFYAIKLHRLGPEEITDLSVSILGEEGRAPELLDLFQHETEGNAFFLIEVIRALAAESDRLSDIAYRTLPKRIVAGGIMNIIQARLDRLPAHTRPLLEFAAVYGRRLDVPLLAAAQLSTDLEADLTAAAFAAVLELHEGEWRFAHDKIRETLYELIPADQKQTFHRQIAVLIEAQQPERGELIFALAHHWQMAQVLVKERVYRLKAAQEIMEMNAHGSALPYLMRARELYEDPTLPNDENPANQGELYHALGRVYHVMSEIDTAIGYFEQAESIFRALDDKRHVADVLAESAVCYFKQNKDAVARERMEASNRLNEALQTPTRIAANIKTYGWQAFISGDYETARRHYNAALALLDQDSQVRGTLLTKADILNDLAGVYWSLGDLDTCQKILDQALEIKTQVNDRGGVAINLSNKAQLLIARREYVAALQTATESQLRFKEILNRLGVADTLLAQSTCYEHLREFEMARQTIEEAIQIYAKAGLSRGHANTLLQKVYILLKLYDQAPHPDLITQANHDVLTALRIAREGDVKPSVLLAVIAYISVQLTKLPPSTAEALRYVTWLHTLKQNPAAYVHVHEKADTLLERLALHLTSEAIAIARDHATTFNLEAILDTLPAP